jgi:hypothetical protein
LLNLGVDVLALANCIEDSPYSLPITKIITIIQLFALK